MASIASGILAVGLSQLSQHTARVADATNENEAANQIVPAFDADLAAIVAAYNSGRYAASACAQALQTVDAQTKAYLQKQVGKPGTAWSGVPSDNCSGNAIGAVKCDKTCTVGCCIYSEDLHVGINCALNGLKTANAGPVGTKGGAGIPEVYGSSYGLNSRAAYTITFVKPPINNAVIVSNTVNGILSPPTPIASTPVASAAPPAGSTTPASSSPTANFLSTLTNTELATGLAVLGGIILIITALFGANALRVNQ
jgi:hypothetical protein